MKNEEVGIVFATSATHRVTFKPSYCKPLLFRGEKDSKGPDLGFVVLPPDTTSLLASIMSFYSLTKQADMMLTDPPPLKNGFWGITGFAEEFTTFNESPPKGFSKAKIFKGGFGAGVVTAENEREGLDYIKYEALYNEHYEGPESFAGFSGGGLWQLLVDLKAESPEIHDRLLAGVAFYESEKHQGPDGLRREINCHGRKSLYGVLLEKVRTEFRGG